LLPLLLRLQVLLVLHLQGIRPCEAGLRHACHAGRTCMLHHGSSTKQPRSRGSHHLLLLLLQLGVLLQQPVLLAAASHEAQSSRLHCQAVII
jgi:hypothetical protein